MSQAAESTALAWTSFLGRMLRRVARNLEAQIQGLHPDTTWNDRPRKHGTSPNVGNWFLSKFELL